MPPDGAANISFEPDPARAVRLDTAVRAGLAASLKSIFESLDPLVAVDEPLAARLLNRVGAGPVPPGLFGVYIELVLALFAERDGEAAALLGELLEPWPAPSAGLKIVTLNDQDLGPGQAARYRRLLSDDLACEIEPLHGETLAAAAARLTSGLDLLQVGAPDLYGELHGLVGQVVLVVPRQGPRGFAFAGASTFSLWGALVLNADGVADRLETAVSLAHEAAHSHLFGLALGGRLVENDDAERYPSPLRFDARPMEGVAHATYVTARMSYALEALIGSARLEPEESARAAEKLARAREVCARGLATVSAQARFTPIGAAAFDQLRRYMSGWS